jgi:hypothetical protein
LIPEGLHHFSGRAILCREITAYPATYEHLLRLRPGDAVLWYLHGESRLIRHDVSGTIASFTAPGEPPATTEFATEYAAALLLGGDEAGYRRILVRQAERRGASDSADTC